MNKHTKVSKIAIIFVILLISWMTISFSPVLTSDAVVPPSQETVFDLTQKLEPIQINQQLTTLEGWRYEDNKLKKEFQFPTFVEAFSFMSALALISERINHHPEWYNVYNKVWIELTIHDAGGVTPLDIEWAKKANELDNQN